MRFTIRHILVVVLTCGFLFAVNVWMVGEIEASRAVFVTGVVSVGGFLGLWRFRKRNPAVLVPPVRSLAMGILAACLACVGLDLLMDTGKMEVCVRTQYIRRTRRLGLVLWREEIQTREAAIIEEQLRYRPACHQWTTVTEYGLLGITYHFPYHRFPMIDGGVFNPKILAHLDPVEKSHQLLEATYPLDVRFAEIRKDLLWELKCRLGEFAGSRRPGTEAEIVRTWWRDFEPLLRPFASKEDMRRGIIDFHRNKPSSHYDAWTYALMQELAPVAKFVGLGWPPSGS